MVMNPMAQSCSKMFLYTLLIYLAESCDIRLKQRQSTMQQPKKKTPLGYTKVKESIGPSGRKYGCEKESLLPTHNNIPVIEFYTQSHILFKIEKKKR